MRSRALVLLVLLSAASTAHAGKYIVELRDGARPKLDVRIRRQLARAVAVDADAQEIARIAKMPGVARVSVDHEVKAHVQRELPARLPSPEAGWKPALHAQALPAVHANGSGITVAIIDTGVDYTHPAFAGRYLGGWDYVNNDADPMDDHRHGTHVAGIVLANGGGLTGVAPEASFVAYKVLNHEGTGLISNIIAALERAADPNDDGDTSDHVDVANISLGGPGHADDPLARAVGRAVEAGVVVVCSAGNEGWYHQIGSPSSAPAAITVGASDGTDIADFSSRGPAAGSGGIKPDVIAPGVRIISAKRGGGQLALSGTSMASPYVAGIAAILLETHPAWTPARVKSAITATAEPLSSLDVMTQGSGVANLARALADDLVTTSQLDFGLDAVTANEWTSTRTLSLRNDGAAAKTIHFRVEGTTEAIRFAGPSQLTLAAGQSGSATFTVRVDNTTVGKPEVSSFSFGGVVVLEVDDRTTRVPWSFLRAGRMIVNFDRETPNVIWTSDVPRAISAVPIELRSVEALLEPGTWDLAVVDVTEGEVVVVVQENQVVDGNKTLEVKISDAVHTVRLAGTDNEGRELGGENYVAHVRLLLPYGGSVELPAEMKGKSFKTSTFSERFALLATETFVDAARASVYVVQHPPLRTPQGDVTLQVPLTDFRSTNVRFFYPPDTTTRKMEVFVRDMVRNPDEAGRGPRGVFVPVTTAAWEGKVYMTPEVHPDYGSGVSLVGYTQHTPYAEQPAVLSPMIRLREDGFITYNKFDIPALPVGHRAGDVLTFNQGPLHPRGTPRAGSDIFLSLFDLMGDRHEWRYVEQLNATVRVTDAAGAKVYEGPVNHNQIFTPLPKKGAYRVAVTTAKGTLTHAFDTTGGSVELPMLTSLAVVDGGNFPKPRFRAGELGALVFSAPAAVRSILFRPRGSSTWNELTPVTIGQHSVAGTIYRADLAPALTRSGEIELSIELANPRGDTTTWHLNSAFAVDPGGARRRAVGH